VPSRERLVEIGTRRGRQLVREYADEIRNARLAAGLNQATVGFGVGISRAQISRIERGEAPFPDFVAAARIARVVGLDLWIRCYPAGGQLRDAAHVALTSRFLARIPPDVEREIEAPIRTGDLRAWDILLHFKQLSVGVAAETRVRDLQALLRREHQKQADGGVERLLLLVADTKHNRGSLAEAAELVREVFPLSTRGVLMRLSRGEALPANGLVIL
jgi:transcriptional regulator with XRE-family HTH domain